MQSPAKAWPNSSTIATRSFLPGPNPAGRPQTVFLSGGYCDAIERAAAPGKNTDLASGGSRKYFRGAEQHCRSILSLSPLHYRTLPKNL